MDRSATRGIAAVAVFFIGAVLSPMVQAQTAYLNADPGCMGAQTGEAASVKYRVSSTNWDQVISTSSTTTYGTIVQQAGLGNNGQLRNAVWHYTLQHRAGVGYFFTMTHANGGSPPVAASTVHWDSVYCYGANPCVSPLRRYNALEMYVKASSGTGLIHSIITADSAAFSGVDLTTISTLRALTAEYPAGVNPAFDIQHVRADTNLALFDWTLTGRVVASFDSAYGGQLDERLKLNVDMIEVAGAAPPELAVPSGGGICVASSGVLDWSDVAGATGYKVQFGTDCGAGSEVEVTASEAPYGDLPVGTVHHWRVKTRDTCGFYGNYSSCSSFTTGPSPLSPPELLSPGDGVTGQDGSGTLDWSDIPGATAYMVQIDTGCGSGTETEVTGSEVPYADLAETTYFWRVKTKDACGVWGAYVPCFSFQVGSGSGVNGSAHVNETKIVALQPNPSPGRVDIRYQVAESGIVRIEIYDVAGRTVRVLAQGAQPRGTFTAMWDGADSRGRTAESGAYFVRLVAGSRTLEKRLLITR